VFRAGTVATTVCPSRVLADNPAALEFVDWWLWSARWEIDPRDGERQPVGAPRWPFRGGLRRQPNRLVEACKLLSAEWPLVAIGGGEVRR
jgi:hypothetical protein